MIFDPSWERANSDDILSKEKKMLSVNVILSFNFTVTPYDITQSNINWVIGIPFGYTLKYVKKNFKKWDHLS